MQTTPASANESSAAQLTTETSQNNVSNTSIDKATTNQPAASQTSNIYDQHSLDLASNFHIFAKQVQIDADCNGNIATDKYLRGNEFGTRVKSSNNTDYDLYYLGHIDNIGSNGFRGTNKVIFGNKDIYEIKGNQVFIKDANGNSIRQDHLDAKDVLDTDYTIDFEKEFTDLSKLADSYSAKAETAGVICDFSDMNRRTIDLSHVDQKIKQIFINIDAQYLNDPQPLTITGLSLSNDGPMVIFNVVNAKDTLYCNTQTKLVYNGQTISSGESHKINTANGEVEVPNHIMWNFGTKLSNLNITSGYFMGNVLAPNAELNTRVNADGNLIAKKVTIGGESHRWDLHVVPDSPSNNNNDNGNNGGNNYDPITPRDDNGGEIDHTDPNNGTTPSQPSSNPDKNNGHHRSPFDPDPAYPVIPPKPTDPKVPILPVTPDKPVTPNTPKDSTDPVKPVTPKVPTNSNKPVTPDTPKDPTDPKPTQPDNPNNSVDPTKPNNSNDQPQEPSEKPADPEPANPDPQPAPPVDHTTTDNQPEQPSSPSVVNQETTAVKSQDVTATTDQVKQTATKTTETSLPQTGSNSSLLASLLGLISLSFTFLLAKPKH